MSLDYIRDTYRVPAKRGGRVEYTGGSSPVLGTIKSAVCAHLLVVLDGERKPRRFHPTWQMRYLSENNIPLSEPHDQA